MVDALKRKEKNVNVDVQWDGVDLFFSLFKDDFLYVTRGTCMIYLGVLNYSFFMFFHIMIGFFLDAHFSLFL